MVNVFAIGPKVCGFKSGCGGLSRVIKSAAHLPSEGK
jgi:hypothetical protein